MNIKKIVAMLIVCMLLGTNVSLVAHAEEVQIATTETTDSNDNSESTSESAASAATTEVLQNSTESGSVSVKKKKKSKKQVKKKGGTASYSKKELKYMASIIYCEAGNQSYNGKLAVGIVVKNRMESKRFPQSIKGVLYQKHQFTPTRNGALNKALRIYEKNGFKTKAYSGCLKAAKEALSGTKSITLKGKKKSMKGYYFFSRYTPNAKFKLGAHMFK